MKIYIINVQSTKTEYKIFVGHCLNFQRAIGPLVGERKTLLKSIGRITILSFIAKLGRGKSGFLRGGIRVVLFHRPISWIQSLYLLKLWSWGVTQVSYCECISVFSWLCVFYCKETCGTRKWIDILEALQYMHARIWNHCWDIFTAPSLCLSPEPFFQLFPAVSWPLRTLHLPRSNSGAYSGIIQAKVGGGAKGPKVTVICLSSTVV